MNPEFVVGAIATLGASLLTVAVALWFHSRGGSSSSAVKDLRQLLLDRAAGVVSADEFERRQIEFQATLLATAPRRTPLVFAVAALGVVTIAAGALYFAIGKPGPATQPGLASKSWPLIIPGGAQSLGGPAAARAPTAGDMQSMVARLAARLEKEPSDAEGWILLGKSYVELRRHADAAAALAKGIALAAADASLLADFADAHVMGSGGRWDEQARNAVARALTIEPLHLKSLALAGTEAHVRKDFAAAAGYWERMKAAAPAGSIEAQQAEANLAEARALMAGDAEPKSADGARVGAGR